MQAYNLDYDEEMDLYVVRGPDGFEWWVDADQTPIEDLDINIVIGELNMLYTMIGGTDDGTI